MAQMSPDEVIKRVDKMFTDRQTWESFWDTCYRFMMPERATFFRENQENPDDIGDEIFDSTAEDSAERLANLIMARLMPQWQQWFKIQPGYGVYDESERQQMLEPLEVLTTKMHKELQKANFYQEMQPALLDRIVGGTGGLSFSSEPRRKYRCVPLNQIAVGEDAGGEVMDVARKYQLSIRQIERAFPGKLDSEFKRKHEGNEEKCEHDVYTYELREVDGTYTKTTVLKPTKTKLESQTKPYACIMPSRWAKIPGSPYGRGPGHRALSDVRALNKIKELSLKNAALETAGPYSVVDDGVINPYTITVEPFEMIPVGSNDINNPSIKPLERSGNFDVGMFQMEELVNRIKAIFMQDQFGSAERTPRSAAEVMERTRILSQDLGASIARFQQEQVVPALRALYLDMRDKGEAPEGLDLDDETLKVEFTSYLSQGQWAEEVQNILQLLELSANFGEVDPEAGFVVDQPEALLRVGELTGVPQRLMRNQDQRKELMQQASEGAGAAAAAQAQDEGAPAPGANMGAAPGRAPRGGGQ